MTTCLMAWNVKFRHSKKSDGTRKFGIRYTTDKVFGLWDGLLKVLHFFNCQSMPLILKVCNIPRLRRNLQYCICIASLFNTEFLETFQSLFLVFFSWYPEWLLILHNISEHRTSKEHHVFPSGWVLNTNLEFLQRKKHPMFNNWGHKTSAPLYNHNWLISNIGNTWCSDLWFLSK